MSKWIIFSEEQIAGRREWEKSLPDGTTEWAKKHNLQGELIYRRSGSDLLYTISGYSDVPAVFIVARVLHNPSLTEDIYVANVPAEELSEAEWTGKVLDASEIEIDTAAFDDDVKDGVMSELLEAFVPSKVPEGTRSH